MLKMNWCKCRGWIGVESEDAVDLDADGVLCGWMWMQRMTWMKLCQ